jgi:molybdopterin synthase catalytic subunit
MTLETYEAMALSELGRIEDEARARWPLQDVLIVHRFGRMEPGDNIVLVVTLSEHREAAFAAAEFLMDFLKTRAPFWKFEEAGGQGTWVAAKEADDVAADRWNEAAASRS